MRKNIWILLSIIFSLFVLPSAIAQPVVSFSSAFGGTVQEGVGGLNLFVYITNPDGNETTVQVTHSGSATYGVDYTILQDTIVFPAGSSNAQPLTTYYLDDCADEPFETIALTLVNPTNGAQIDIGTITTTISDDDAMLAEDCTYTVPSGANVVTTTISFYNHNRDFWVCQTGNLTLPSNLHSALVEDGGQVRSKGNDNEFYVKSGGTVIVDDGDQNLIYAESGATVTVESGLCNAVFLAEGAIFIDNGTETFIGDLTCAPLIVDYSSAPANGCMITAVQNVIENLTIEIFPNPTTGEFVINNRDNHALRQIEIYDAQGKFLEEINVNDLKLTHTPGIYLVRFVFDEGVAIRRLIKI